MFVNLYLHINYTHTYIQTYKYIYSPYIPTKSIARNSFGMRSVILNKKTRLFTISSFLLYNNGRFYNTCFLFPAILTNNY